MINCKIRGSDWLSFPLIIINFNHFFIQPAPNLLADRLEHKRHPKQKFANFNIALIQTFAKIWLSLP